MHLLVLLLYCRVDLYCAKSAEISPEADIVVVAIVVVNVVFVSSSLTFLICC